MGLREDHTFITLELSFLGLDSFVSVFLSSAVFDLAGVTKVVSLSPFPFFDVFNSESRSVSGMLLIKVRRSSWA